MFFDAGHDILRTAVVGLLAYVALVAFVRLSGKRTLAKMNAFDLVVTVALGSTLATVLLSRDVALAEGAFALGLLVALQYVVAWSSARSPVLRRAVKSQPALLVRHGRILGEELRRERVTAEEVRQALRQQGVAAVEDADAVVLETDGTFSVLTRAPEAASALADVRPGVGGRPAGDGDGGGRRRSAAEPGSSPGDGG